MSRLTNGGGPLAGAGCSRLAGLFPTAPPKQSWVNSPCTALDYCDSSHGSRPPLRSCLHLGAMQCSAAAADTPEFCAALEPYQLLSTAQKTMLPDSHWLHKIASSSRGGPAAGQRSGRAMGQPCSSKGTRPVSCVHVTALQPADILMIMSPGMHGVSSKAHPYGLVAYADQDLVISSCSDVRLDGHKRH